MASPVTTVVRTIVDMAATVAAIELEQSIAQALSRRLTTGAQLTRALEAANGRRGIATLRGLLSAEAALTRSAAEERLLGLVRTAKLPEPATNVRVAGF